MEGPTPVSSLLHSATMVTAGIFLIIRTSFIFAQSPIASSILCILGTITALVSGLIGLNQYDLKRVIAYSTCSQLGFMMLATGLGYYSYAFFHLVTHAFFKCLLFLCSGSIIHALNDEQDLRKMGNLFHALPVTFTCMLIGSLALTGFPFLSGFYSKDLILETTYVTSTYGILIFFLGSFAAFLTSFYSIRSLYFVFFRPNTPIQKSKIQNIHEAPVLMLAPMIILSLFAIFSGFLFQGPLTGPINIWKNSIFFPIEASLCEHEYIPLLIKLIPTIFGILGLIIGYFFFSTSFFYKFNLKFYYLINLTAQKFYFDNLYNLLIAKSIVTFGYVQYILFDRGYLELFGPLGLTSFVFRMRKIVGLHNGFISHYLILFFITLLLCFIVITIFNSPFALIIIIFIAFFFFLLS
jgi:NADH:ubiquinone oxidoreductase subunit 5 (subunit L)/multisubunit Na+/H+ antiporter MnhA subunit